MAANAEIPDYSAEQYYGTEASGATDWKTAKFVHQGTTLGFYDYVRAKLTAD